MSQIILFEMPEDPALRPKWLEQKLRSRDCGLLLEELAAMRSVAIDESTPNANVSHRSLEDFLGPLKARVLKNGLGALPKDKFEGLMRSPELLSDLVIEIEFEGGDYWKSIGNQNEKLPVVAHKVTPQPTTSGTGSTRYWLGAMAALAAALLLAIALWPTRTSDQLLAWQRPGVFDVEMQGAPYLNHLADAADEWFKQDPRDPQQLQQQIQGFRRGCDLLLSAAHPQLSDIDRAWLRERCAVWSEKFDQQLASLERGDDWSAVRNAVDETVMKLIDALRKRAGEAT